MPDEAWQVCRRKTDESHEKISFSLSLRVGRVRVRLCSLLPFHNIFSVPQKLEEGCAHHFYRRWQISPEVE